LIKKVERAAVRIIMIVRSFLFVLLCTRIVLIGRYVTNIRDITFRTVLNRRNVGL
jgi:hypothetical protein